MNGNISTILLTGEPGVGKTTLVRKVCEELQKSSENIHCQGFYTEEVCGDSRGTKARMGFDVVSLNGKRGILARENPKVNQRRPKIGKYSVYVNDFEAITLPLLQSNNVNLLVIDEIGKMELISKKFETTINTLLGSVPILATAPLHTRQSIPTVDRLKSSSHTMLLKITKTNRDSVQNEIIQSIHQMLGISAT